MPKSNTTPIAFVFSKKKYTPKTKATKTPRRNILERINWFCNLETCAEKEVIFSV